MTHLLTIARVFNDLMNWCIIIIKGMRLHSTSTRECQRTNVTQWIENNIKNGKVSLKCNKVSTTTFACVDGNMWKTYKQLETIHWCHTNFSLLQIHMSLRRSSHPLSHLWSLGSSRACMHYHRDKICKFKHSFYVACIMLVPIRNVSPWQGNIGNW